MKHLKSINEGLKIKNQTDLEDTVLDLLEGDGFQLVGYRVGRWDPEGRNFAADINKNSREGRYTKAAFSFTLVKKLDKPYLSSSEANIYSSLITKLSKISERYDYDVYYLIDAKKSESLHLATYVVLSEK
jgi:hypothetical protein